jgi:hypothetical protein
LKKKQQRVNDQRQAFRTRWVSVSALQEHRPSLTKRKAWLDCPAAVKVLRDLAQEEVPLLIGDAVRLDKIAEECAGQARKAQEERESKEVEEQWKRLGLDQLGTPVSV